MLKKESNSSGELRRLSPAEQHRLDGEAAAEDLILSALERQFGAEVVAEVDPVRAAQLRQEAVQARLAATVQFQPTPETLRYDRQIEFGGLDNTAPFSPLSGMVDVPTDTQLPTQPAPTPVNNQQ